MAHETKGAEGAPSMTEIDHETGEERCPDECPPEAGCTSCHPSLAFGARRLVTPVRPTRVETLAAIVTVRLRGAA